MTPTEPTARAELLARLDKWASTYPTWGNTEDERRCRDAAAQIRADAATIQTLTERAAQAHAAGVREGLERAAGAICAHCRNGHEPEMHIEHGGLVTIAFLAHHVGTYDRAQDWERCGAEAIYNLR